MIEFGGERHYIGAELSSDEGGRVICLVGTADLLSTSGLVESKSEAKRLLSQGAVEVDGRKFSASKISLADGTLLRVGSRRFLKLKERQEG